MPRIDNINVHQADTQGLGGNLPYGGLEWRSTREPDYRVYVYNVSARTLSFGRFGKAGMPVPGVSEDDPTVLAVGSPADPWKSVNRQTGKPEKTVAGKENERYHFVTSFPQPILIPKFNDQSNRIEHYEQDAIRYVVDLINPDNLGKTLEGSVTQVSQGVDLSLSGVFFSLSNPPFAQDVRNAIDRMEKRYTLLLEKAATLELTDKAQLASELGSNPDYAFAADYFGKAVSWRRAPQRTVECPNCGEQKPAKRLFHMASFGAMCIEQTQEAWQAAVNSGVKRYDDVPEEYQWKKAEKPVKTEKAEATK